MQKFGLAVVIAASAAIGGGAAYMGLRPVDKLQGSWRDDGASSEVVYTYKDNLLQIKEGSKVTPWEYSRTPEGVQLLARQGAKMKPILDVKIDFISDNTIRMVDPLSGERTFTRVTN